LNYFRDPGSETCQYRASQDLTIAGKAWYKIPVKRCDLNENNKIDGPEKTGKVCNSNLDCPNNKSCIIDTNDYLCSTSYLKTFGSGGAGNQVPVPDQQAGLCDGKASGCAEYIDPVSRFAPNLIYNPGFETTDSTPDGWGALASQKWNNNDVLLDNQQVVTIEPNRLYIFSTRENTSNDVTKLTFLTGAKALLRDNNLGTTTLEIEIPAATNRINILRTARSLAIAKTGLLVGHGNLIAGATRAKSL
jgi:hypothetical protein